jgi:Rod binding domain-containing protein
MNVPISQVTQIPSNAPPVMGVTLPERDLHKLWDAAKQLEATFSSFLLKEMKMGTAEPGGKESFAADIYGDMFKRSLAEQLSTSGSLGLAKQIYEESAKLASKAAGVPNGPPEPVKPKEVKETASSVISPSMLRFNNYTA